MKKITPEQFKFILQFIHVEKLLADFPGITDDNIAAIFSIDGAQYRSIRNGFNENARKTAETLLADPEFAELVDRLPFAANSTVLAVGDSVTDDDQSWLEILRHLVNLKRPDDEIRIINAGVSGDTTTHALSRFSELTLLRPDWVLFLIGLNDARKHGVAPGKTLVSVEETGKTCMRYAVLRLNKHQRSWSG